MRWWIVLTAAVVLSGGLQAAGADERLDLAVALDDVQGQRRTPLKVPNESAAAVVVFITSDCPIANAAIPELNAIAKEYGERGVQLILAHVVPDLDIEKAQRHADDYQIAVPVVIDRRHQLVAATGATVTPEAAVIDAQGQLVYRGQIDDRFAGYGQRRAQVRNAYLRQALDAVLADKPVTTPRTKPLGCFIPELDADTSAR